ncbi:MAG: glycosyltransferase, partial [Thermodesulfobacteriota bacterium]|nr:glycosyltransferase [Thermodesulfobacteriota bacterium]
MKILHVLDHSLPLHSGYTFRSANLFREQLKRGWRPVVVTSPKHEASWKGPWSETETIHGICYHRSGPLTPHPSTCYSRLPDSRLPDSRFTTSRFTISRFTTSRFTISRLHDFTISRLHDFTSQLLLIHRLSQRIQQVAAAERPDLLHAHSPVLNALAALRAGRRLGLPVVYEIRAFWEDAAVDHGTTGEGSLRYRFTRALETWACRRVDHVAVLCHGIRGDLIRRGIPSHKITPVFNGVDTEAFGSVPPDEELRESWGLRGKT